MKVLTHTFTGRMVDIEHFKKSDVDLTDISISLSRQRRYAGHTAMPYSVAQHSVVCSMIAAVLKLNDTIIKCAFLHDAEETWVQDVVQPIKRNYMLGRYAQVSDKVSEVVYDFFGLGKAWSNPDIRNTVRSIDQAAYHYEASKLIPSYRYSDDRFTQDAKAMIAELEELKFEIPQGLIVFSDSDMAQLLFEQMNVIYTEHVLGAEVSSEPQPA